MMVELLVFRKRCKMINKRSNDILTPIDKLFFGLVVIATAILFIYSYIHWVEFTFLLWLGILIVAGIIVQMIVKRQQGRNL